MRGLFVVFIFIIEEIGWKWRFVLGSVFVDVDGLYWIIIFFIKNERIMVDFGSLSNIMDGINDI